MTEDEYRINVFLVGKVKFSGSKTIDNQIGHCSMKVQKL